MPTLGGPARPPASHDRRNRQPVARLLAWTLALAVAAARAQAQQSLTVDVGGARISQAGIGRANVATLGSELRWGTRWATASANAIAARTPDDRWTGQGLLGASLFTGGPLEPKWELGASVGGFGMSNDLPSTSGQLLLRRFVRVGPLAGFVGAGGGATTRDRTWRGTGMAQTGATIARRGVRLTGLGSYVDTRRELRVIVPGEGIYHEEVATRFTDLAAYAEHERSRLLVTVGGGTRLTQLGHTGTAWGMASVTWWALPRFAIVGATGRALEDIVRGVPAARYAALGVRVALADRAIPLRARRPADEARPTVAFERASDDDPAARLLVVHARGAARVEVMADFTDWEPVALTPSGDRWTLATTVASGAHRLAVRLDGGAWQVPANLPPIDDDFGGRVGLVSVP